MQSVHYLSFYTEASVKIQTVGSFSMQTILGRGFPLPATPKGYENGAFIYRNDTDATNSVKPFLGVPEYGV